VPHSRLLIIATLSGAWALALEVLWVRGLVLQTGGPLSSFTITLTSVMAGMAGGSLLGGRIAARPSPPLRALGWMQLGIAAFTLLSAWIRDTGGVTRGALRLLEAGPDSALYMPVIVAVAGLGSLAASLGIGAALPILSATAPPPASRAAGLLAAASALGGAAGAVLCGFLLLPLAGLTGSLHLAACAAALSGLLCLMPRTSALWQHSTAARSPAGKPAARMPARPQPGGSPITALAATGLALTALQITWSRVAALSWGSTIQSGSLLLAAVILGLAAGNAAGSRRARSAVSPVHALALLTTLAAMTLALSDPILGRLPLIAARLDIWMSARDAGVTGSLIAQFLVFAALVSIPTFLLGSAFPLGVTALARGGDAGARPVAAAAGASAAGNLLGAPLAFAALASGAGSRGVLRGTSILLALAAVGCAPRGGRRVVLGGLLAVSLLAALPGPGGWLSWDPAVMSSGPYMYASLYGAAIRTGGSLEEALRERGDVILTREGPQALVTVRALPGGVLSLQVNGKTDASTGGDMKVQTLMSHLPLTMMQAAGRSADDVLVVGLGSGVSLAGALAHPIRSATVVELLAEVVQASAPFDEASRGALRDPRVRLLVGDARARLLFEERAYDAIVSQPSNPWVAGQAVLFTREFFELARRRLRPGGVMCQWLQSYGLLPEDFKSVVATFGSVFPHVTLWEESVTGGDYLLLGSDQQLDLDPAMLAAAISRPAVRSDLERIEIDGAARLLAHFVSGADALRSWMDRGAVTLQTEDRLQLEFTAPAALRRETPGLVLAELERVRRDPAELLRADAMESSGMLAELARIRREGARERRWAEGLGLLSASRPPDFRLLLASSYLRGGMRQQAISVLRDMRSSGDLGRLARLLLAHLAMSDGDPRGAIRELEATARLDPHDAAARVYLARAAWAAGDLAAALAANGAALTIDAAHAEAHSDRCGLLLAAGDLAGAEAACREAVDRDPRLAEAHANLGLIHARRWRVQEAEASYQRALERDPDLTDARFNLAALLERTGRSADALAALSPALAPRQAPDAATLRLGARTALSLGMIPQASSWLAESLRLEPDSAEGALLGKALIKMKNGIKNGVKKPAG